MVDAASDAERQGLAWSDESYGRRPVQGFAQSFAISTFPPTFMPVEMALVMWKWRLSWASSISRSPVGNDFQQARGNQSFRHFHMSTIFTPYGGPASAERRRPAQAVGA
jgi:hypothetical protein